MSRRRKIKGTFCEREELPKSAFDRRSFRWTHREGNWIMIGCPRGHWNPRARFRGKRGRCEVGTRAHVVLSPAPRGTCPRYELRITKGS